MMMMAMTVSFAVGKEGAGAATAAMITAVIGGCVFWGGHRLWKEPAGSRPPPLPKMRPIKSFPMLTVDDKREVGYGRWFRLRHWQTTNFVMMLNEIPDGLRVFSEEEKVAGVTFENRETTFFSICLEPGFRIYLQREEDNVEDSKAIKVMGTCDTFPYGYHLGYLERETAYALKDAVAFDARPYSLWLPVADCNYGLRVTVLVPSKNQRKSPPPIPPD